MRRPFLLATAALLALALSPLMATGQEPLPESDPATSLYRTALVLEADGEYDLADSLMDYILRRYPESAAAAAIRRARSADAGRQVEGDGRTELVVWSTLYGLWLGVAVPAMLGAKGSEPYGLGLLIGGPAGFGAAWSATDDVPITDGQAGAITWAGSWGTWQGFGWAHVFDFGRQCPSPVGPRGPAGDPTSDPGSTTDEGSFCGGGPSSEALFGSMIAGGLIGGAGGIMAARSLDISPGDATLVNLGSLWGTWYGVALGVIADVEGDDLLATTLIGGNLGAGVGAALARAYPVSRTQARIASIIGVVGGLAGAGFDLIIQPESEKVAMAIPAVTSALGLALGASRIQLRPGAEGEGGAGVGGGDGLGGAEWTLGGPVFTTPVRGPDGEPRTAVGLTLLSGRF